MFLTIGYKQGFIHYTMKGNDTYIMAQVSRLGYSIQVKSTRAAKLLITRFEKEMLCKLIS